MRDMLRGINWYEYVEFFNQGSPPVYMLIIGFNLLILIAWAGRRMSRSESKKHSSSMPLLILTILGNFVVLSAGSIGLDQILSNISI